MFVEFRLGTVDFLTLSCRRFRGSDCQVDCNALESCVGLQNHDLAFARSGRFFGAATFTSDVRLYEVQYSREGDFKKAAKVMDLKKAHNSQAGISDSVQPTALMHTLKLFLQCIS